jgi:hypothetical protein
MIEEAYQKCKKTQGHGTWAEERAILIERSQGHIAATLLENGPEVPHSARRQCG